MRSTRLFARTGESGHSSGPSRLKTSSSVGAGDKWNRWLTLCTARHLK